MTRVLGTKEPQYASLLPSKQRPPIKLYLDNKILDSLPLIAYIYSVITHGKIRMLESASEGLYYCKIQELVGKGEEKRGKRGKKGGPTPRKLIMENNKNKKIWLKACACCVETPF